MAELVSNAQPIPDRALKSGATLSTWDRIRLLIFGTIRNKIIVPFLFLTLTVAMLGTFIVTRLVASNAQDRVTNQLLEVSRATSDSMVYWEQYHLDTLRLTAFSVGVPEAIRDRDERRLNLALTALAANQDADIMVAIAQDGSVVSSVQRTESDYEAGRLVGQNLVDLPPVGQVLAGSQDGEGDKFAEIVEMGGDLILLTTAPVYDSAGAFAGVIAVGTPVRDIFIDTKSNVLADLTLYEPDGQAILTTFVLAGDTNLDTLNITPEKYESVIANAATETAFGSVSVNQREYQLAFVPLVVRGETLGVLGVASPTTLITSLITTNRSGMTVLFSVIAALVVVLGYVIAANLATPIRRLAHTAQAVRAGDLRQQSGVRTADEIGILGRVFDDMTVRLGEQTETLQRLYEEQEKEAAYLGAVIASTADGTVVVAMDGAITRLNPVAEDIIRRNEELWLGALSEVMSALLRGDPPTKRIEVEGGWFDVVAAPVRTTRGDSIGVVMTLRDVTELVLTDRMRTAFILQMSHELYTPLTSLKGYMELAYSSLDDKHSQAGVFLPMAIHDVGTLSQMITQMIDVGQMVRGGFDIHSEPVDTGELVKEIVERTSNEAANQGIEMYHEIKRRLVINADGKRLKWALEHLIDNAINYTLPGGKIGVYAGRQGGDAVIRVLDSGVGISSYDLPRIFEQFYRGNPIASDGTVIDVRGTGLGLFIVEQVVMAHGGSIEVESEVGKGSEFTIRLPLLVNESQGSIQDVENVND